MKVPSLFYQTFHGIQYQAKAVPLYRGAITLSTLILQHHGSHGHAHGDTNSPGQFHCL
jgi:hypothetical protein